MQLMRWRWITRRGAPEWPARSLDLTLLDFLLWGFTVGYKINQKINLSILFRLKFTHSIILKFGICIGMSSSYALHHVPHSIKTIL